MRYRINEIIQDYSTLFDAIYGLKKEGYPEDFNLKLQWFEYFKGNYKVSPNDFVIDKHFHFDDNFKPSNQSIIYAIASVKNKLKGVLINGDGIYWEATTNVMLEKLE